MAKRMTKAAKTKFVLETYEKLLKEKKCVSVVTLKDLSKKGVTRQYVRDTFFSLSELEAKFFKEKPHLFPISYRNAGKRKGIPLKESLEQYMQLKEELGRIPTQGEIKQCPYTPDFSFYHQNFGKKHKIEEACRNYFPEKFSDYSVKQLMTNKRLKSLRSDVKKYNRFLITTAVTGCDIDESFYKSLKRLAKAKKAKILVLVCSDPARSKESANKQGHICKELAENETIILEDTALNRNLHLSTIKLTAKQINPLTGLQRLGKQDGSFVYASPKFFLKYTSVRNSKNKWPHAIMTTGAVTKSYYKSKMYMSQRTAKIAEFDHRLGAVYVEIKDKEHYHFRQVQCLNDEGVIHLDGELFSPEERRPERPEAFVMGDIHIGATCPKTRQAWVEIITKTKPKKLILHDALNGHSINHWIEQDIVAKMLQTAKGLNCLESELKMFAEELKFWSKMVDEIIIVPSNHNDWLERWLRSAKYAKDAKNHHTGVSIAKYWMDRLKMGIKCNPVQPAIEDFVGVKIDNLVWLDRNADYYIGDVQINCHGDKGVNGSRGSLMGMESSYGSSISGHSHTAGIIRDTWAVGTSTHLQEDYNNGPSTWTNTSGLIYRDGSRCLYNAINGEWHDGRK